MSTTTTASIAVAPLAVDEEPDEVGSSSGAAVALREGDVLPDDEVEVSVPPVDAEVEAAELDAPAPVVPAVPAPRRAPGVERYGEAVVRQVLGARFVREEPYQAPTRFG